MRTVITVDGFAASGKSSLSMALAQRLGFTHFSSGILYRGVGFLSVREKISPEDSPKLCRLIASHKLDLLAVGGTTKLLIDGKQCGDELHTPEVSDATSRASAHLEVRKALIVPQREVFAGVSLVAEGRDMGTIIYTDSPLKFFLNCDVAVRAERRVGQLIARGQLAPGTSVSQVKDQISLEITERDRRDEERAIAPTKPASDAIIIDNGARSFSPSLTQVVDVMYNHARSRGLVR